MKSYIHDATGKTSRKLEPTDLLYKYEAPTLVVRSDGSISVDKTAGYHSRKGKKLELRNANRARKKSARQRLKRQLEEQLP